MSKPTESPDGASIETNESDSSGKTNHNIYSLHVSGVIKYLHFNAIWGSSHLSLLSYEVEDNGHGKL